MITINDIVIIRILIIIITFVATQVDHFQVEMKEIVRKRLNVTFLSIKLPQT